ncbi:MAG TPA: DNA-directed RNA polymerase subunit omega [Candidatus Nitrosotenuis sp.]|nr:DNA-directed RNA polymerase subunit omega [Candidatus Nitrosotenuis sp.]
MQPQTPTLDELLKRVDNKFRLVTLTLKRARQLNDGSRPLVEVSGNVKPVTLALVEIAAGKVVPREPSERPEAPARLTFEESFQKAAAEEAARSGAGHD